MNHGGVVFLAAGKLAFLPATVAQKVLPIPSIAAVPGGPPELRGIALVDGDMIAIVSASGMDGGAMLLCSVHGEAIGLVGVEIVATGRFEAAHGGHVHHADAIARTFDLASLITKVRESRWGVTLSE